MGHRDFKDRTYAQFARIGAAMASEKRLELIDLLAQAPRNVEALADETGMSVANTSQHLQALKAANLVESARDGTRIVYRLASEEVLRLWLALRAMAEARLAEVGQIVRDYANESVPAQQVSRKDLRSLVRSKNTVLVDVRPRLEYEHRHIPGAIAIPLEELGVRLVELPKDKQVIVYCRGSYCQFADDAVVLLRQHGFDALRLEGGWPEWAVEHPATETAKRV
jgi:rhodanese-related sulfurtransferase